MTRGSGRSAASHFKRVSSNKQANGSSCIMDFDRRTLLLATSVLLISSCAKASSERAKQPAKAREGKPAAMPDHASRIPPEDWRSFKARYLQPDGRIVDTGNGGISHSEGQGYGMLFAEHANDQEAFDSLFGWTEQVLARKDIALYSWRYAPAEAVPVADNNNASDGDILIAWALMRAHLRWRRPEYAARAAMVRAAIATRLIYSQAGRTLLLPALAGFVGTRRTTINPSYYIWPALDLFRQADGAARGWGALIADGERLAEEARFGSSRLPSDWVDVLEDGSVVPTAGKPPRFGFDAVRVPLYQLLGNRRPLTGDVAAYWRMLSDSNRQIPAWVDVLTGEQAPYPLSGGGMAIVHRLVGTPPVDPPQTPTSDYFSDALSLLAKL
jgi:endo-1,4-beta-D-glucanase Y